MRWGSRSMTIVLVICLLAVPATAPPASAALLSGSLIGFVSDQAGIPQMGAVVFLYNRYDRLVGRTLTNEKGAFGFDSLLPGVYSLRVSLASFVPAVKQNIKIQPGMRSFLSVNLASVLSSIELIYSATGDNAIMNDDWKWVLRTAAPTRPVLRILPEATISELPGRPKPPKAVWSRTRGLLKLSTGEEGSLAAAGTQTDLGTSFALATSLFGGNELQFSGNFGYASNLGMPTAGFRTSYSNELWGARPEVALTMRQAFLGGRAGTALLGGHHQNAPALQTMSVSTLDRRRLTDSLLLEYGASMESVAFLERLNYLSPFARLTYDFGEAGTVEFAYNSGIPPAELLASEEGGGPDMQGELMVLALFPRVSLVDGEARIQRAQNFELAYRKVVGSRRFSIAVYRESMRNAAVMMAAPAGYYSSRDLLPDLSSNSSVFNLGDFQRIGYTASVSQQVGEELTVSVAYGNAGVLKSARSLLETNAPGELRRAMRTTRRNWLAARLSGTAPWAGTHVTASYQWTDYGALSPTHLYLTHGLQPQLGLNIRLRQSLPSFGMWSGRLEATAELRNLLAQGYVPITTADGRKLYLIQNPRAVRGGLSFIF